MALNHSHGLVEILSVDDNIIIDLPYKTTDNFTGKAIYPPDAKAYLREPVAHALCQANQTFMQKGHCIKVWDAYRPFSAQKILWQAFPDERYVLKPVEKNGQMLLGSMHNKGTAVDMTLVDAATGDHLPMPTDFDDFSEKAGRAYNALPDDILSNRNYLSEVMSRFGFVGMPTEWWHFDWSKSAEFDFLDIPIGHVVGK